MANTRPVIDTPELAAAIKARADALGLIDLYPVLSLTRGMEGKELSDIKKLSLSAAGTAAAGAGAGAAAAGVYIPLMLSEDGKDLASESIFLAAMKEARRLGLPVSCHCDFGGAEAEAAKKAGEGRRVWSRIEENNATRRAVELGREARCHIHIAHVSTKEAVEIIRRAKAEGGFTLSCEAMPHNIALTEETAHALGDESYGRVNPPLRTEEDRQALIRGLLDNTIDAVATDHAPHTQAAKARGTPGFSGLETAFSVCYTTLVRGGFIDLRRLSFLMSAKPARRLGLGEAGRGPDGSAGRGKIASGFLGDLVIVDPEAAWKVEPELLKTRGKNSAFAGKELWGKILMTLRGGRVVYSCG
jgi:dihydroorotase